MRDFHERPMEDLFYCTVFKLSLTGSGILSTETLLMNVYFDILNFIVLADNAGGSASNDQNPPSKI